MASLIEEDMSAAVKGTFSRAKSRLGRLISSIEDDLEMALVEPSTGRDDDDDDETSQQSEERGAQVAKLAERLGVWEKSVERVGEKIRGLPVEKQEPQLGR